MKPKTELKQKLYSSCIRLYSSNAKSTSTLAGANMFGFMDFGIFGHLDWPAQDLETHMDAFRNSFIPAPRHAKNVHCATLINRGAFLQETHKEAGGLQLEKVTHISGLGSLASSHHQKHVEEATTFTLRNFTVSIAIVRKEVQDKKTQTAFTVFENKELQVIAMSSPINRMLH